MSSVDNRIVRMQFDNEQFERGVMQSMKTLDELNEKLQFKDAGKGISALQVHLNNVNFDGIQNAIQHINHSFTSMTGMVAQRIKEDIVDNVINAAKRLEQVTLGQIKSGGKARAQNIANAKFMIEGLKYDWEAVQKAADYAVTDTAYGLDAAAKAASQLAASGVDFQETIETVNGQDLTQMHKSLRAISGVAAMTNASYDEIAHIFTSVAGMGKLTAMQMNQLSLRGLNIASTIAQETGKTEQEIREMVSKGQISFQMFADAMDSAYGEHAKDANKTFQGSLSNLKAALSRIGAIFQQPVIDKTNTFFVSVTKRVKEFQAALNDDKALRLTSKGIEKVNKQLKEEQKNFKGNAQAAEAWSKQRRHEIEQSYLDSEDALKRGDVENYSITRFATHFAEAWEAAVNFASKVVETLDLSWFTSIGSFLDKAAIKATNFFGAASKAIDKVKESVDKTSASIADSLELDMNDLDLLHRILKNEFGYVEERWAKLDKIYKEQGSTKTGKWLQGYMDQLAGVGYHFEKLGWTEEEFKKKQEELSKSEAQRVSEMTKEELLIANLGFAYENLKHTFDGIKRTVGNSIKVITNVATAIGRVITYIDEIGISFQPYMLTDGIAKVSDSLVNFSQAIQPSQEFLWKLGDAMSDVGDVMRFVSDTIFDTTAKLIDFVASCLKADESLDELSTNESLTSMQRVVLDLLRVIDNARRFFSALGKIAIKAFKSIKTAFSNAFGGKEIGGALTAVTGSFTLLTDGVASAAEKVAEMEAPFHVIEVLFGTIFNIVRKVSDILGKVTTGIRKFRKGTDETTDSTKNALKAGEKSQSFLEGLGVTIGKAFEWVKELPKKLKALWEAIKQQEGVKNLKESFDNLWDTLKSKFGKDLEPITKNMNELTRVTGGEGETAFGALADGIGKVADKLAKFIDKFPQWGEKVSEFFTKIKEWVGKTIDDLHLDELGAGISGAFAKLFTTDGSLLNKIKTFVQDVFDSVMDGLSGINWKEVGKGGILGLVAANLFNFFRATSGLSELVGGIKEIPQSVIGVFKGLKKLFIAAENSLEKATSAYVLANAAKVILAMTAAIVLLKDIPKDDLNRALAAVSFMAFIIWALLRGIGAMLSGMGILKNANAKVIDNSTKNLLQINNYLGKFFGAALLIGSIGASVWLVAKAITMIMDASKGGNSPISGGGVGKLAAAISVIDDIAKCLAMFTAGVIILCKLSVVVLKTIDMTSLVGLGAVIFGVGIAVASIAGAIWLVSQANIDPNAVVAVIGIVSSIILLAYVLGTVARWADFKALLALALDMVVMSVAIGIIVGEVMLLSTFLAGADLVGKGPVVLEATSMIAILMVAMGAAMLMMGKGLSNMKKPAAMIPPILAMASVIIAIGWTIKNVAAAVGNNMQGSVIAFFAIIAIIGMIAITIEKAISAIRTGDSSTKTFTALAGIFAAVGVCMILMSKAVENMSGENSWKGVLPALGALIVVCIALGVVAKTVAKVGAIGIADVFSSMAITFVAMGASMILFAVAAQMLESVVASEHGLAALIALGAVFVVLIAAFGVIAGLCGSGGAKMNGMKAAAAIMLSLGAAFALFGVGALLFASSVGVMAGGMGLLANGISVLAESFAKHKITVIVLLTVLALLTIVVVQFAKLVEPVAKVVGEAGEAVVSKVSNAGKGLKGALQNASKGIQSWWKGVQPKTKAMIITGIGTLCSAIIGATPQLLKTAKALLKKLMDFLIDVIPDVVHGLLEIIIKIVNSLAEEIRSNSARIVYAIFNLLESLLEVVLEVLNQLVMFIFGNGKIGQTIAKGITSIKGGMRAHLGEMKAYSEEANDLANKAQKDWLDISASEGSPYAQDLLDDVAAMEQKLDDSTEAVEEHTDAMNGYFEAAAKGAKTRIPGIPIEVSGVDYQGKAIGGALGDGIKDGTAGSLDGMTDMFGDMLPDVGGEAGSEIMDGMNLEIEDSKPELYETTQNVVQEGPVDAIADMEPEIRKSAREHISEILVEQVGDEGYRKVMETRMWSNGGYLMRGLAKGIDDHLYIVGDKMTQVTNLVNGNFVGPMKINSPSKLFEQNGLYVLMGLAKGIDAGIPMVETASENMSNTVIDSFGAPLDYLSRIASGELVYDPTIRPILDSSSIGRGAGAINSMFRNQNVSLSGFSGQLAADIGQLDSRNSDVVEELRALREEMSIMGEEISNMQVVMDTGALVGATAAPMDRALGRRVAYKGRGN